MKTRHITYLVFSLLIIACTGKELPGNITDPDADIYLEGYHTYPLTQEINTVQPMTGIVFWPAQAKSRHAAYGNAISLEFSYCLPSDVVTGKSGDHILYDWTSFENLLNDISGRYHQAIVRFRYEYPSATTGGVKGGTAVPAYIKALSDYHETYSANPGGDGPTYYADWSNPELQWFTKQFYTDFAARYDNDPRIAFVQAGFGHWSEYHIYGTGLKPGVNFPTHQYQAEFLTHLDSVFKVMPWSISIDAADKSYTPIVNADSLLKLGFGLFDDSFMHSKHEISQGDGYNERCWISIGTDRWKKAPAGGEISYYTASDQKNFLNPEGMYGFTWEEAASKYHMTYIIGNDAPGSAYATPERMKEAALAAGYHFKIADFRIKGDSSAVKITNAGIAPIYKDAYVAVNGIRSAKSLKSLLPDSTMWVKIPSGGKEPVVSIESDYVLPDKKISFEANVKNQ